MIRLPVKYRNLLFLIVSLALVFTIMTEVHAVCPAGDLNGDCTVDLHDLAIFAQQWLTSGCSGSSCADLDDFAGVAMSDFAILGRNWKKSNVPLTINEFMASNDTSHQDPQGEYDDWIEIYNPGNIAIDIGGMYLTDDLDEPNKWQIPDDNSPATTIDSNGYLLIWADSDTDDGTLHANFKLDKDGEQIGLFDINATALIDSVTFDQQYTDISYGRYPDANDDWRFFGSSTPGAENSGAYLGVSEAPQFSRIGGTFTDSFSLTITAFAPNAEIRYTTDRSIPDSNSPVYTGPIFISNTDSKVIRAKVYEPAMLPSSVVTHGYIPLAPDVQDFNSNLPIFVIDSDGCDIDLEWEPWVYYPYRLTYAAVIDINNTSRASITDPPDFAGRAGIRVRGDSSAYYFPKKQYSFETWDVQDDQDKDVSILGFPAHSDWILYAPYSDKTLMRNVLAYKWSNDIGRYTVRTRFVELFYNANGGKVEFDGGNGPDTDYRGVYVFMEKIRRDENRVDIEELEPADTNEPEISGGYIIKHDKNALGDEVFITNADMTGEFQYHEPKSDEITNQQKAWIKTYLDDFEDTLNHPNFADPIDGYAKYVDVDSFIDYDLVIEMMKNIDGHKFSNYMYKDRGGKLVMGPQWDFNLCLGNCDYTLEYGIDWLHKATHWYSQTAQRYDWYDRMLDDTEYEMRNADRWFALREEQFSDTKIIADMDYYFNLLNAEAAARNFARWNILDQWVWPNYYYGDAGCPHTYQMEVEWTKNWLAGIGTPAACETYDVDFTDRLDWLDTHWGIDRGIGAPPSFYINGALQNQNAHISQDDVFAMTNPHTTGTIYYTLEGTDPRMAGGSTNPSALAYNDGLTYTSLVTSGAVWKYLDNGTDQGTAWTAVGFDDSAWASGPTELGYGDGAEATVVSYGPDSNNKYITTYFRHTFNLADASEYMTLALRLMRDDGAVVYLNGNEIKRDNMPDGAINYLTVSTDYVSGTDESTFFEFADISSAPLTDGNNVLAVEIHQDSITSSDISFDLELIGAKSDERLSFARSTVVKARIRDGSQWTALNQTSYGVGPVAENLRITEIMYHPFDPNDINDPNTEFVELKNIGPNTINLHLVSFTNGIYFTFPDSELAPGQYVLIVQDVNTFETEYGSGLNMAGQYSGRLDNAGERITLEDATGSIIHNFEYQDDWRTNTDGDGFSLTIVDSNSADPNSWDQKNGWRPSAFIAGSPGYDDSADTYNPGDIVINEMLAHSDAYPNDWIELHNTTTSDINISGWFISDSDADLTKYQIPPGSVVSPNDYIIFTQDDHFGAAFGFSEHGETAYLSSGLDAYGNMTGYREKEDFDASENNVAFGRHLKSTATFNFVAMSLNTPGSSYEGAPNAYPKVGPIVITEIMYNPITANQSEEYIELCNISGSPVTLYDPIKAQPWMFTDGIEFTFPTGPNTVTLAPNEYILVVKNPVIFTLQYSAVPGGIQILGPYDGQLSNGGEKLEISKPGDIDNLGTLQYIRVDRVNYDDQAPWPIEPDGNGNYSLARKISTDYGNDPANWKAATPSPGLANP